MKSNFLKKAGAVGAIALVASPAFALSPPDTTELVNYIEGMWAPISAVVGAFTMIIIGLKGMKLIRRS